MSPLPSAGITGNPLMASPEHTLGESVVLLTKHYQGPNTFGTVDACGERLNGGVGN